jgi:hypothetical protein
MEEESKQTEKCFDEICFFIFLFVMRERERQLSEQTKESKYRNDTGNESRIKYDKQGMPLLLYKIIFRQSMCYYVMEGVISISKNSNNSRYLQEKVEIEVYLTFFETM